MPGICQFNFTISNAEPALVADFTVPTGDECSGVKWSLDLAY